MGAKLPHHDGLERPPTMSGGREGLSDPVPGPAPWAQGAGTLAGHRKVDDIR